MKAILTVFCALFSLLAFSQAEKVKQIDSIVNSINAITTNIRRDTTRQNNPQMGFDMMTIITTVTKNGIYVKYSNNVIMNRSLNGVEEKMNSTNTFYFDNRKLIKVEEAMLKGSQNLNTAYYYDGDTVINFTPNLPEMKERAEQVLLLAKTMFGSKMQ